jgi:hypothetical protein
MLQVFKPYAFVSLLMGSLLVLAACSQASPLSSQESDFIHSESSSQETLGKTVSSDQLSIISELELDNGNTVRFINEQMEGSDSQIGVVEVIQPKTRSVISALTSSSVSPLELYLALSAEKDAPQELTLNHEFLATMNTEIPKEPREVSLSTFSTQADEVKSCLYMLDSDYHRHFLSWVETAFGAALPKHEHGHYLTSDHYGVTGFAPKRALGTCNASGYVKYVDISFEWIKGVWIDVPLGVAGLTPGQSLFYHSNSGYLPKRYRIEVDFTTNGLAGNNVHTEGSW